MCVSICVCVCELMYASLNCVINTLWLTFVNEIKRRNVARCNTTLEAPRLHVYDIMHVHHIQLVLLLYIIL